MLPIHDDNPSHSPALVTWTLMAACVGIFLYQFSLQAGGGEEAFYIFVYTYGMIPAELFGAPFAASNTVEGQPLPGGVAPALTVITSMFLHGGWMHLAGNMLYLFIFGDNVEDAMGKGTFILFYVITGIAAALTQGLLSPDSTIPMIGASGAISGVLGAYLVLYPRANVRTVIFVGIITVIRIPAIIMLGIYFALQLISGLMTPAGEPGVAFWAHIGGFVAGVLLGRIMGTPPGRRVSMGATVPRSGRRRR